jgi:hypothetical protein
MSLADSLLDWDNTRRSFEWRGQTLYTGAVTVQDLQTILKKHPNVLNGTDLGGMVEVIIRKVEDEQGERVFTLEHKPKLMRMPIGEITELFNQVFTGIETPEDAEKN